MASSTFRPLVVRDDPDWVDLQLWTGRHERIEIDARPWLRLAVGAQYGERSLGFWMLYPLQWADDPAKPRAMGLGPDNLAAPIYLLEAPPQSDAFLQTLATLWRVAAPARMAPHTALWAIDFGAGHPEHVLTEEVRFLAVVGDATDAGGHYGQMQLSINLPAQTVTFAEREPDCAQFRRAIVQALAAGG